MRLGFDATPIAGPRTGVGRYAHHLLGALLEQRPELDIRLINHRPLPLRTGPSERGLSPPISGRGLLPRPIWMQTVLPLRLATGIDLCHYTNHHAPIIARVPYVMTLHDLSLIHSPRSHPPARLLEMRPLLGLVARRARAVICPTTAVQEEAISLLGVSAERARVVPEAPAPVFRPIDDPEQLSGVAARHGLAPGFILSIGSIEPRKNLTRLLAAYARLRRAGFEPPLVVSGGGGWKADQLRSDVDRLGLRDHVRFVGHVNDDDLAGLINLAAVLAYPSLYEGFGLPIVEAMACGTPVVTSDRGATAEVAGDAALKVDPLDVEALADGLTRAVNDESVRARLRAAGLDRVAGLTWERTAARTASIYREALGSSQ